MHIPAWYHKGFSIGVTKQLLRIKQNKPKKAYWYLSWNFSFFVFSFILRCRFCCCCCCCWCWRNRSAYSLKIVDFRRLLQSEQQRQRIHKATYHPAWGGPEWAEPASGWWHTLMSTDPGQVWSHHTLGLNLLPGNPGMNSNWPSHDFHVLAAYQNIWTKVFEICKVSKPIP